jgi:hypothetical protein
MSGILTVVGETALSAALATVTASAITQIGGYQTFGSRSWNTGQIETRTKTFAFPTALVATPGTFAVTTAPVTGSVHSGGTFTASFALTASGNWETASGSVGTASITVPVYIDAALGNTVYALTQSFTLLSGSVESGSASITVSGIASPDNGQFFGIAYGATAVASASLAASYSLSPVQLKATSVVYTNRFLYELIAGPDDARIFRILHN